MRFRSFALQEKANGFTKPTAYFSFKPVFGRLVVPR